MAITLFLPHKKRTPSLSWRAKNHVSVARSSSFSSSFLLSGRSSVHILQSGVSLPLLPSLPAPPPRVVVAVPLVCFLLSLPLFAPSPSLPLPPPFTAGDLDIRNPPLSSSSSYCFLFPPSIHPHYPIFGGGPLSEGEGGRKKKGGKGRVKGGFLAVRK